jgi:FkbM family methyltransferase
MRTAKLVETLAKLKRAGVHVSTIIDVGIQHSTPVLMKLFQEQHHVLFEPVQEYYSHIRDNYSHLSYTLVEAAVSDLNGQLLLHTEKKTRGDEISHSYIVGTPSSCSRSVQSLTLDHYFSSSLYAPPYLLKIDVEGPDVPNLIIRGASQVLKSTAVVVIEMTVDKLMERATSLHEAGFDVWDICDLCYYGDCLWQADFVFVNRILKQSNIALRPMHDRPFRPELWQKGFDQ